MKCVKCGLDVEENSPFCGSCGEKIEKQKNFCGGCGAELEEGTSFCGSCGNVIAIPQPIVQQQPTINVGAITEGIKNKIKAATPFLKKYKFIIGGTLAVLIIALGLYFGYQNFHDFTKLSWEKSYGDYNSTHVMGGDIKLKVNAFDKEDVEIKDITFEVSDGQVTKEDSVVVWTLPEKPGTYKITAKAPSGKKVEKEVTVLIDDIDVDLANGLIKVDFEEEDNLDSDMDGLTDKEEKELGTNPLKADTDMDGLLDSYEVNVSKTDPLKADTDSDGLIDGAEVELGTDPLKETSKDDGIKDGDREFDYTTEKNGVKLVATGTGNINSTTIDISTNTTFSKLDGISSIVYDFNTNGKLKSAKVTVKYNTDDLLKNNISEDTLSLYYFDVETKKLEKIETQVDKKNKTVTATLTHFSKYVLADNTKIDVNSDTKVLFVIDDSVSMYSEAQMIELGYNSSTGAVGNDTEFKRLSLSNSLIELFSDNYKVAISEFSGVFELKSDFTNDKSKLKETINGIKNTLENASGTAIVNALNKSIEHFNSSDESNKYIILMTDGKETQSSLSGNKDKIIQNAQAKDIKICVIGLGDVDSAILTDIANKTGCGFYYASNASALEEIYKTLGSTINYDLVDTDSDGKVDSTTINDSGFIVTRDGFSFKNYGTVLSEGGNCYGMATFAMLYYTKELPSNLSDLDENGFYFQRRTFFNLKGKGYNLKNTYFFNSSGTQKDNNLYDYNPATEALNIYLNKPDDYRDRIEDEVYYINKTYHELLKDIGINFSVEKYKGSNEFKKYENALLNTDSQEFKDNTTSDEYNLLHAIYRLFILQATSDINSFTTHPDASYTLLEKNLDNGIPVVLTVYGGHAVNATKLLRDNEDSNKFKIEVYDNNYPGEVRYIEVTRNKIAGFNIMKQATWNSEYQYTFSYGDKKDIRVTVENLNLQ
jgi:Predicted amidophosphoribosyltransferases